MNNILSFVIPAKNEQDSLVQLYQEICRAVEPLKKSFEIVFIDDGSTDETFSVLKSLHNKDKTVKVVKLRGNWGKSTALQVGFDQTKGDIIFTLDGDLQDNPRAIPTFLKKLDEGYDLVSGWKKARHDPSLTKVLPSRIVNFLARKFTGMKIHDVNCGFKAYKRDVIENLNLYGELYRFIPIIAAKQNYRVGEIVVDHRPRIHGQTKFGWSRGIKGILDLLTIIFLTGFKNRPGHFFGSAGLASFSAGFIIGVYVSYLRLTTGSIQNRHPLLFLGMLLMIIGVQLVSTGLLAEMIIYHRGESDYNYAIKEILK